MPGDVDANVYARDWLAWLHSGLYSNQMRTIENRNS